MLTACRAAQREAQRVVRFALREAQLAAWRTAPVRARRAVLIARRALEMEGGLGRLRPVVGERVQRSAVDVCCEVFSSVTCLRERTKH